MQGIGLAIALFVFIGVMSALYYFMLALGWIIALAIIILLLISGVISGVKHLINRICHDKNKGP